MGASGLVHGGLAQEHSYFKLWLSHTARTGRNAHARLSTKARGILW